MIKAKHITWAEWIFAPYIRHLFKQNFFRFHLLGDIPVLKSSGPTLLLPNHSTWWDGFFVYYLNKILFHRKIYLMMLEEQLATFPFFAKLGAFGIRSDNFSGVRASLLYALEILNSHTEEDPVLLCMFPQGELQPWQKDPLEYRRGFHVIAEHFKQDLTIVQLGIKTEFLDQQRPEVFFKFSVPEIVSAKQMANVETYRQNHRSLLWILDQSIRAGETGETLFDGRASISTTIEQLGR